MPKTPFGFSTYLSLVGIVLIFGVGYVFMRQDKAQQAQEFFHTLSQNTGQAGLALQPLKNGAAATSNLASNLVGTQGGINIHMVLQTAFQTATESDVKLEKKEPWSGKIFETLTPFDTLVTVNEFLFASNKGNIIVYTIQPKDASVPQIYPFLVSLATGANQNDKVLIQEIDQFSKPAFYYIHLDTPERTRIVAGVTESLALAIDLPIGYQNIIPLLLQSFN